MVVTPKISHKAVSSKLLMQQNSGGGIGQPADRHAAAAITRHSNPMGQIQKLQIVSLGRGDSTGTNNNNNLSANSNAVTS